MLLKIFLKKIILIILIIYNLFFVIGAILSPVLSHLGLYNLAAKITFLFVGSCHQNPLRSFYLFGYPFALCARCFGVYLSCTTSSIFLLMNKFHLNKFLFLFLIAFTIFDITLNTIFSIDTGNILRFFAGISIGLIITTITQYLLEKGENI